MKQASKSGGDVPQPVITLYEVSEKDHIYEVIPLICQVKTHPVISKIIVHHAKV